MTMLTSRSSAIAGSRHTPDLEEVDHQGAVRLDLFTGRPPWVLFLGKGGAMIQLDEAVAVLSRTPATLRSMLAGLGPRWTETNEGGETWSPFDVVGHLIHGERTDWIPRARTILEAGETRPFEPFDRFAQFRAS